MEYFNKKIREKYINFKKISEGAISGVYQAETV